MNVSLGACEGTIHFLHAQVCKFGRILQLANKGHTFIVKTCSRRPRRQQTPYAVINFVLFCEHMMKRFKGELEELKR